MMLSDTLRNCLLSIMFALSNANEDIVVREPQKPMAIRKEHLESRFKDADNRENIPTTKLPIVLTNNAFETSLPRSKGADAILYLGKAPKIAPIPRKRISIP